MVLWTVQDSSVVDIIDSHGFYRVRDDLTYPYRCYEGISIPDESLMIAYKWMAKQLSRKAGPAPAGTRFPIWTWYVNSERRGTKDPGKPDMRSWAFGDQEEIVRIKLDVDESRVLLSNFELWHIPLNRGYLAFSQDEADGFDDWYNRHHPGDDFQRDIWDFNNKDPFLFEARRKLLSSWKRVLCPMDPRFLADQQWNGNVFEDSIQGVLWEIRKEDILSIESFKTPSRHKITTA